MKRDQKRWLSGLLCLTMVLSMLPMTARADTVTASGSCGESLTWELMDDGTLVVSGSGAMTDYTYSSNAPWYQHADLITALVVEPGVTSLGSYAFQDCIELTSVTLPTGLTTIEARAFSECSSLTSITLPEGLISIGDLAFQSCDSLGSVTIPKSVTSIGETPFRTCYALQGIWVDPQNTHYASDDRGVLFNKAMTTLLQAPPSLSGAYAVPEGVTTIGGSAFELCMDLTSIDLPVGLTRIEGRAFRSCQTLTSVTFPEGLTTIGAYAFTYCCSLPSLTLPKGLTTIGSQAFAFCYDLTSVTLPEGLISIENSAFHYCESLTSIDIPKSVTTIGSTPFNACYALKEIRVDPENDHYASDDRGVLFNKTMTSLIFAPKGITGSYTAPEGLTSIEREAFAQCYDLTSVTLPEGLTSIGDNAFNFCRNLNHVTLPEGLTYIGDNAFGSCEALTHVTLPEGLTSITKYAFSDCDHLTSVTLRSDLTAVGVYAFNRCNELYEVFYFGTASQWNAISIDIGNEPLSNARKHYLSSTPIVVSPTCTDQGYTAYRCTHCIVSYKENLVPALGHSYSGGSCTVCGAADPDWVVDPGLALSYPTLSFEDEIFYNVYYTVEDMTSVVEMGLMLLPSAMSDGTMDDAIGTVPGYVTNGTSYLARTEGIPAVALGDTVYFKVYARLTDGSYAYSDVGGYHARAYADTVLSGDYTDAMKSLVVAMMEYGAQAQTFFGHNADDLVNSGLTEDQKALVSEYDETMMDPVVPADSAKTGSFVRVNSNFQELYPSVSFDGAFSINYYCTPAITVDSGMTLYWWDSAAYESIDQFTLDNATGSMEMTATNSQYWGNVPGIAAKDMDKTYYVSCVFESGGETITTGIIPYSLGKYCAGKAATDGDAQQPFAQATAVYGYYAKQYFASIA